MEGPVGSGSPHHGRSPSDASSVSLPPLTVPAMTTRRCFLSSLGAVARGGKLLYSRGFGLADREAKQIMPPDALFRIASISKPITAVAVLVLVEKGKLDLDAKIHELLALEEPVDPRFKLVTVRHLLQHTGGWDRDKSFDPMFRPVVIAKDQSIPPPAMPEHILKYMLKQKLDFDPGEKYAYSNFGYAILGLLIAKVAGKKYGEYVEEAVLKPLKMGDTKLGKTLLEGRAEREVKYYEDPERKGPAVMGEIGAQVPLCYGAWCLEAMDAHGGWLSTAPDLVRFASAFDRPEGCPVLSAKSIAAMFARPEGPPGEDAEKRPKEVWYGCGWSVRTAGRGINTWHTGSLSGTSTILVRRSDGFDWAVLFNSRGGKEGKPLSALIDGRVHGAVDQVKKNLG
jgi:CubicO group peptidase (beta-lactamase class C family)